jgi:tetratricopeptide (TPR) repeat protein
MTAAAVAAPGARLEEALALRAAGRLEDALAALAQEPPSPEICTLRGDLLAVLGRLHDAIGQYSMVHAFLGEHAYVQYQLALCLRRLERWDLAAEAFRKVLECEPSHDAARIALGDCLLRLERHADALACFDGCRSEAAQAAGLFGKAVALQRLGRFEEAEWAYQRHLVHDPESEEALANLIALNVERRDLERIEEYSRRLLELRPRSRAALQGLTLAALERRDYAAAARHYARLAEATQGEDPPPAGAGTVHYHLPPEAAGHLNRILAGRSGADAARTGR